jgi:hypothetical protein
MLSLSEAKQILGSDADELTDQEITELCGVLEGIASVAMDKWIRKKKENLKQKDN